VGLEVAEDGVGLWQHQLEWLHPSCTQADCGCDGGTSKLSLISEGEGELEESGRT